MISIIGAGPVGCYTAYLLAKYGYEVQIFEKNKKIGYPVRCTGLVTPRIEELINLDESFIVNQISKVIVNSESESISLNLKEKEIVLNRAKFDIYLAKIAKNKGVKIYLNHLFESFDGKNLVINSPEGLKKIKTDILIGADGPKSKVASIINKKNPQVNIGMQARIELKHDKHSYEVFLGEKMGHFAWIVPETEKIARVGMLTKNSANFRRFVYGFGGKIIDYPSGIIPLYQKMNLHKGNIYIVGDAAAQLKNTTGGGLFTGLLSAKILADSIKNKKNYTKKFNQKIKKNLMVHDMIYRIMSKMKDNDYNIIIKLLSCKKAKKVLEQGQRDFAFKFIIMLFWAQPKLILFSAKRIKIILSALRHP